VTARTGGGAIGRIAALAVPVLIAVVLWGYVAGPMAATLRASLGEEGAVFAGYAKFFDFARGAQGEAMLGSLFLSAMSVLTSGAIGVFLAVLLHRWDFPLRKVCQVLVLAPIALPPLIGVESIVLLCGIGGVIPQLLARLFHVSRSAFEVKGMAGVLVAHTLTMYPYFYLSVRASLAEADDALEEAAFSLGASTWDVWRRVLLPMLTPGIVAGALLTFMSSMASYTAPLLFNVDTVMTSQIVNARVNGDLRFASVVSVMLAAISTMVLIAIRAYERRGVFRSQSKGGPRRRQRVTSRWVRGTAGVAAIGATAVVLLPIAMIVLLAFSVSGSWRQSLLPSRYTTGNFATLLSDPEAWAAVRNSVEMSAIAAFGATLLGVTAAYAIARMRFRGKAAMDLAMMLPWALPGTVVAINLITAFASPSAFSFGRVLVGTYAIVPLAYFVRFSPLVFRSTSASMAHLDPSLEEAAWGLGCSRWGAFRRAVLPLVYRGILAGALLAFVDGVGEFVATVLVYTPRFRPLSIAINDELYYANHGMAAAYGVLQILLTVVVLIATRRLEDRQHLQVG
jgi:iron(III) transport system permease protein